MQALYRKMQVMLKHIWYNWEFVLLLGALLSGSDGSTKQSFFLLPQLFHHPHTNRMDKEVIILSGVIVLVVLLFVSANKWQKAEKKLKIAEKKLEEYKQGNSSDSFS